MNERLYRSRSDRMVAGVAGGLAEIWDADPSLIRVVWAVLVVLTGGIALLVYIVMAIVVPDEDTVHPMPYPPAPGPGAIPGWTPPGGAPAPAPGFAPSPDAATTGTPAPVAAVPAAPWDPREARRAARAARRAARREHGDRTAGLVIGGLLIVVGGVFFVRQLLPNYDFDWFWPVILIGLGVVILVAGFSRDSGGGQGNPS